MTSASDPTHELVLPLAHTSGAAIDPVLQPAPITSSPGLATAAAAPPGAPAVPPDDPASIALLIAKVAGEMFGGASVVPIPEFGPDLGHLLGGGAGPQQIDAPPNYLPSQPPISEVGRSAPAIVPAHEIPRNDAVFGDLHRGAFDLPLVAPQQIDAPPNYLPSQSTIEAAPAIEPAHELSQDDAVFRDLHREVFDPNAVRRDFPILDERIHGKRLVWLDNAATTQKPRAVIDRLSYYYEHENSNIHRGAHTLAARATDAFEQARETTAKFLNAPSAKDVIFVRGATEGINLVAQSWGRRFVVPGDEIVITHLEHHANIVPWQQLCAEKGARLKVAPVDDRGDVMLDAYERLLGERTKLVAFPQVSNALGTVTPAREMIEIAHRYGAKVLLDGAQAVSHLRVDVQALDCDFYTFSGHKVFAPTGIGVVWGKRELLEAMPPWQGGGNMIQDVTFERTTYQPPPFRFEAGTANIADAAGLGAALDYVMQIGMDVIDRYEHDLLGYATERLLTVPGLTIIGTSPNKAGVISFVLDGHRTEDIGAALDKDGIAVRSGHHCAQPILRRFGLEATVRASLALYNTYEDIDELIDALRRLQARPL
jgi:cysteine desulfurase/selenocysteine lyase